MQVEIGLLRDYRTRLIADVVTGKLDVRGAAAQLPEESAELDESDAIEEVEESEPLDDTETLPESDREVKAPPRRLSPEEVGYDDGYQRKGP